MSEISEQEVKTIFAQNLLVLMEQRNIAQKDLAKLCGVTDSAVSTWCTGLNMPRMDKIEKLANYFGVKKSDLIEIKAATRVNYLSKLERQIVTTVRKMTPPGQQAVLDYAEFCAAKPEYQRPAETMPFAARAKGGLRGEKSLTPEGEAAWNEMQDEGSDPIP